MEKSIRKKLKIVIIAFFILSIPLAFVVMSSIRIDVANKAFEEAIIFDSDENINSAIQKIDDALRVVFWKSNLPNQKIQLLYRKKEYRKALDCIKKIDANIFTGLLYEHLGKSDSARLYYKKQIPILKENLRDFKKDEYLTLEIERNVALIYTFLGEAEKAKKYLREIPSNFDFDRKNMIQRYDFFIESYKSGGYKEFLEGETVFFCIDSIQENVDIDSLFEKNRFYYDGCSGSNGKYTYEIKKIFEEKAISTGMSRIYK